AHTSPQPRRRHRPDRRLRRPHRCVRPDGRDQGGRSGADHPPDVRGAARRRRPGHASRIPRSAPLRRRRRRGSADLLQRRLRARGAERAHGGLSPGLSAGRRPLRVHRRTAAAQLARQRTGRLRRRTSELRPLHPHPGHGGARAARRHDVGAGVRRRQGLLDRRRPQERRHGAGRHGGAPCLPGPPRHPRPCRPRAGGDPHRV
ncbi:MAG: Substrate-specific component BioY of biotin ECF transporter, partial [uncultured Nocardioides sp.]